MVPEPVSVEGKGVPAVNVIALIVSFVLFLGGMVIMGYASEAAGWEALAFFSGIICIALAFAIPVHVLGKTE